MTPFEHLSGKLAHAQLIEADVVRVDIEELASVLAGYEIAREEAIDEFVDALIKPSNYERFDFDEMLTDSNKTNDFFKYVFAIAEQLKEKMGNGQTIR